jgi:molecular chaperone GrpE
MASVGENEEQDDDNELKTSNLVKEQETKAIREDLARLEKTLEEERKRNEEYLTSLRYLQADFENYRKRVDREIRELEEFSTLGLVRKLIPVLDDLDLAVATAGKAEDKGILEGVKMVQKNLNSALESEGLHRIKAVGEPFNPSSHEAVDKVQGNDSSDKVVEEMRKGYTFKGKVLRPSAVKVELAARKQAAKEEQKQSEVEGQN